MDDQKLRKLLEKVHAEIENTQSMDANGHELLRDLETDIRGLLARSKGNRNSPNCRSSSALTTPSNILR